MNIKEYVKIQADICNNESMKVIFCRLKEVFYPTPVDNSKALIPYTPVSNIKNTSSENSFYKRKVRINLPEGKSCIGLINSDGYDIKMAGNKILEFEMVCDKTSYYYSKDLERIFFKEFNSRIVHVVDKNNYKEHRSNIAFIGDYCWKDDNRIYAVRY